MALASDVAAAGSLTTGTDSLYIATGVCYVTVTVTNLDVAAQTVQFYVDKGNVGTNYECGAANALQASGGSVVAHFKFGANDEVLAVGSDTDMKYIVEVDTL